jgi:hypothetical protein
MIYQLAFFHVTLVWQGMTTYDFIVTEQKRARERDEQRKQQKKMKLQQKQSKADAKTSANKLSSTIDMRNQAEESKVRNSRGNSKGEAKSGDHLDLELTNVGVMPDAAASKNDIDSES